MTALSATVMAWMPFLTAGLVASAVALLIGRPPGMSLRERVRLDPGAASRRASLPSRAMRRAMTAVARRRSSARRTVTREAYTVLGAELRAGRSAEAALTAAADVAPSLAPVARVARSGGDVPAALVNAGAGGRALALAWGVGDQAGIGLAALVDRVSDGIADDQEIRREVEAQLAGPRATGRMLAGLPAIGLLLATGFGDPLDFLLGSVHGVACLVISILLALLGLWWMERLARRAVG